MEIIKKELLFILVEDSDGEDVLLGPFEKGEDVVKVRKKDFKKYEGCEKHYYTNGKYISVMEFECEILPDGRIILCSNFIFNKMGSYNAYYATQQNAYFKFLIERPKEDME